MKTTERVKICSVPVSSLLGLWVKIIRTTKLCRQAILKTKSTRIHSSFELSLSELTAATSENGESTETNSS